MAENPEYWVFGYGSLCWNPGFEFKDSMVGYVEGFSRKFWQGNIAHRGTKEKVTL
jgi:cation transport protein ChaC